MRWGCATVSETLTIQQVTRACGVNPVTLRAWERRYGLVKPGRTDKGHRRYRATDLERIRQIQQWLARGVPISQVAPLLQHPQHEPLRHPGPWQEAMDDALTALEQLNTRQLEARLNRLLADYGHQQVINRFCEPLRRRLRLSPALGGRYALFNSVLTQKWGARVLSLAPKRRQKGWLLVPVGPPWAALELAMTLNRPLWCLTQPPTREELAVLVAERPALGVLWVMEERPTARQAATLWPRQAPTWPAVAWGPGAALTPLPSWLPVVGEQGEALADTLDTHMMETATP